MSQLSTRPEPRRTIRPYAVVLIVVTAAIIGILASRSVLSSAPSIADVVHGDNGHKSDATTANGGALPDRAKVFDDRYPGVANLDPKLRKALRKAAKDAADDGVEFYVNSGWRSPAYQERLLREAVSKYGSQEEASRWVATPDKSSHVSGHAVDIGHADAKAWLSEHGARYGLCQIYRNEPWHYELRPRAVENGCPRMYADPTRDPRMR
ncbi:M15 family metallopeptidase [Kribbella deserti]|uniref:M15 family metallopeptidase n=1 Tax=Kribbella deserti TaxID=1926257 RepID=A0ABV6QRJ6_9ACTN